MRREGSSNLGLLPSRVRCRVGRRLGDPVCRCDNATVAGPYSVAMPPRGGVFRGILSRLANPTRAPLTLNCAASPEKSFALPKVSGAIRAATGPIWSRGAKKFCETEKETQVMLQSVFPPALPT